MIYVYLTSSLRAASVFRMWFRDDEGDGTGSVRCLLRRNYNPCSWCCSWWWSAITLNDDWFLDYLMLMSTSYFTNVKWHARQTCMDSRCGFWKDGFVVCFKVPTQNSLRLGGKVENYRVLGWVVSGSQLWWCHLQRAKCEQGGRGGGAGVPVIVARYWR